MLYLSADEVRQSLPMSQAVEAMKHAFAELATGQAIVPPRAVFELPADRGDYLLMPALTGGGRAIGTKLLTLLPGNPQVGRQLIYALMTVFDGETGEPVALMDGGVLTALRSGGASGAATDFLARADAAVAGVFGAGRQARAQLEAVACVRPLEQAFVFDTVPEAARDFATEMSQRLGFRVEPVETAAEAVSGADIVCTATSSGVPAFADGDVRPGTHINAIGCYHPNRHEVPPETVARSRVVVDQLQAAKEEAGDIVIAIERGLMSWDDVYAELGELSAGLKSGRQNEDEVTLFKSVGLAVQDLAAALWALDSARELGLGMELA